MLAMTLQGEVTPERTVTVKLPDHIKPGWHELVVILDQDDPRERLQSLDDIIKISGEVPSFATLDGVAWQRKLRDEWS